MSSMRLYIAPLSHGIMFCLWLIFCKRTIVLCWSVLALAGDDPEEVKARLKYWAQAVACTVKLCSWWRLATCFLAVCAMTGWRLKNLLMWVWDKGAGGAHTPQDLLLLRDIEATWVITASEKLWKGGFMTLESQRRDSMRSMVWAFLKDSEAHHSSGWSA